MYFGNIRDKKRLILYSLFGLSILIDFNTILLPLLKYVSNFLVKVTFNIIPSSRSSSIDFLSIYESIDLLVYSISSYNYLPLFVFFTSSTMSLKSN